MRRFVSWMGVGLIASTLVACSGSMTGGIVGAVVTVIGGVGLLFFGASTQSGCSAIIGPCLSPVAPPTEAPGSDAPGSDAPGSDAPGSDAPRSGAPVPDAPGATFEPCLTMRQPSGPKSVAPDSAAPASAKSKSPSSKPKRRSPRLGPCLSIMPDRICLSEDAIPQGSFNAPNDPLDRAAIKARLIAEGALPQDVIDRLG